MRAPEARSIPVADIQPCPLLEGMAVTDEDIASAADRLSKEGLPKPLLVRPLAGKESSKYELIWGGGVAGRGQTAAMADHHRANRGTFG
jgi:hypothetical protein